MISNDVRLLWNNDLNNRDIVLEEIRRKENKVKIPKLSVASKPKKYVYTHTPSKYADSKYSHAVSTNHPWRSHNLVN